MFFYIFYLLSFINFTQTYKKPTVVFWRFCIVCVLSRYQFYQYQLFDMYPRMLILSLKPGNRNIPLSLNIIVGMLDRVFTLVHYLFCLLHKNTNSVREHPIHSTFSSFLGQHHSRTQFFLKGLKWINLLVSFGFSLIKRPRMNTKMKISKSK